MGDKFVITGQEKVTSKLKGLSLTGKSYLSVKVGYGAGLDYAAIQHEDLTLNHPNGGQAKFLEQPARTLRPEMREIIKKKLKQRRSLEDALMAAGQLLYDASQEFVPVLTGALKASGTIEIV